MGAQGDKSGGRRWPWIAAAVAAAIPLLAVVTVLLAARALETSWARRRIVALVHRTAGIDLDWRSLRLDLATGLRIEELTVRSPPAFRTAAPDMLRAGLVEVDWSPESLRSGGPPLSRVLVRDLTATVVEDAHGNSLSALAPPSSGAAASPAPLSSQPARWLARTPPARAVDVTGATVALVRLRDGAPIDRTLLRLPPLHVQAEPGTAGWALVLRSRSPGLLEVRREKPGAPAAEARAKVDLSASLAPRAANLDLEISSLRQSFIGGLALERLLSLSASVRFEPARGQTQLDLTRIDLAGGAARGTVRLDLPDAPGAPAAVTAAGLDADLAPVAAVAKALGFDPGPLRGRLHAEVRDFVLAPLPRLGPSGVVETEGRIDAVAAGALSARGLRWSLRAAPDARELTVVGSLSLDRLRLDAPRRKAAADGLVLRLDPVRLDPLAPLSSPAEIHLSAQAAALELFDRALQVAGAGATVDLTARSRGRGPLAAGATIQLSRLSVRGRRTFFDGPVRLGLTLAKIEPVLAHPAASRGEVHADLTAGALHAVIDAARRAGALDFTLSASAASLGAARAFQPATFSVPWERMGLSLTSAGRVEGLAAGPVRLRQRTELRVDRPAFAGAGPALAARALDLVLVSNGTARRQDAGITLMLRRLSVGMASPGDGRLQAKLTLDADKKGLHVRVRSSGEGWPATSLDATAGFDRAGVLSYDGRGHVTRLAALASLVPALRSIDLASLGLSLASRGLVRGILDGVDAHGLPRLSRAPAPAGKGTLDLRLTGLHWSSGDEEARVPSLAFSGRFQVDPSRRHVDGTLTADAAHVAVGPRAADLQGIAERVQMNEDPRSDAIDLTDRLSVHALRQRIVPEYPIGRLTIDLSATLDRDRTLRLSRLSIENAAGGTALDLSGGLMLGAVQKKLALHGEVRQDLSRICRDPEVASGRGTATLAIRVESPDLFLFRTAADVRLSGVSLSLPGRGVRVDTLDGEVPVNADFSAGEDGIRWLRGDEDPYLRFPDRQPLLHRRSFVSARSVVTPDVSIAPIAGNLRIEQNIVSMSQMEMGVRGGRIAGECTLDWEGRRSTLRLHVRANGVQSSHGEPFDGNAALVVSGRDRSVDGHAEILKIGRRHLLDLLDVADPHRTNAAANHLRRDLALGYPDHVRLVFDHGFADAAVRFGGLASLFKVGEMRGIPMEPLVDRLFASFSDSPEVP